MFLRKAKTICVACLCYIFLKSELFNVIKIGIQKSLLEITFIVV